MGGQAGHRKGEGRKTGKASLRLTGPTPRFIQKKAFYEKLHKIVLIKATAADVSEDAL